MEVRHRGANAQIFREKQSGPLLSPQHSWAFDWRWLVEISSPWCARRIVACSSLAHAEIVSMINVSEAARAITWTLMPIHRSSRESIHHHNRDVGRS